MEFLIHEHHNINIAELISDMVVINNAQDALNLMADADYSGARRLIIKETHLSPKFFDLKSKLAGEILQKFSNYSIGMAIIGNFDKYPSKNFQNFIQESNRKKELLFLSNLNEVLEIW